MRPSHTQLLVSHPGRPPRLLLSCPHPLAHITKACLLLSTWLLHPSISLEPAPSVDHLLPFPNAASEQSHPPPLPPPHILHSDRKAEPFSPPLKPQDPYNKLSSLRLHGFPSPCPPLAPASASTHPDRLSFPPSHPWAFENTVYPAQCSLR